MRTRDRNLSDTSSLLKEGRTCWKVSNATRAALLVDGEQYFSVLREALLQAREQILIAGWDFDSRILLPPSKDCRPSDELACAPLQLGELLGYLLRTRPGLRIDVVRWDYHWLYRGDREADTREKLAQLGVHFHEHDGHPVTGCVHYKIVVIDDVLAFCGGIDLTHHRWDTCGHDPDDAKRCDCTGSYMPVHDTQLCVAGPVAAHLGDYLRDHWPDPNPAPRKPQRRDPFWPDSLAVELENIRTGICRTQPNKLGENVREIEAFYLAAIRATNRTMYIENQYFTSTRIAQAIADRCRSEPAVEGLLVGMERPKTPVELHTMGYGRRQFHDILNDAGVSERVPLVAAMSGGRGINLHSKTAIFDDRWLTVGSANLNRRSMGFDVECNLVLEATTAAHRQTLKYLRNRLVAEHVGMTLEQVEAAIAEHGLARLPSLATGPRCLTLVQPLKPEPIFGPVLAPLFDRDELWMPTRPAAQRQGVWYAPVTLLVAASLFLLGEGVLKEIPSLTRIQQQLERILDS